MPNAPAVSSATWIGSGNVSPTTRLRVCVRYAPRPSIVCSPRRHSRKSRRTRGSRWFVNVSCVSIVTRRSPSGRGIEGAKTFPTYVVPACANPDRNRERQPARERQARVFQEHPESELVILQHVSSRLWLEGCASSNPSGEDVDRLRSVRWQSQPNARDRPNAGESWNPSRAVGARLNRAAGTIYRDRGRAFARPCLVDLDFSAQKCAHEPAPAVVQLDAKLPVMKGNTSANGRTVHVKICPRNETDR